MIKKQKWMEKLVESGNRLTKPRELIMNLLSSTDDHLSADDIYIKIHKKNPGVGLTTVYRTLDLLSGLGIVFKFDFGENRTRFELNEKYSSKKHHHHLVCNVCKRIIDYSDFMDEEIKLCRISEDSLSKRYNFKIEEHIIHFLGVCEKCRKKSKNK
jgi:Fur family transcriptional regulator, ferric uptake regulator